MMPLDGGLGTLLSQNQRGGLGSLGQPKNESAARLKRAEQMVRKKYPIIGQMEFRVQAGNGPGFAEFYPAEEKYNPNPGIPTIEVRRTNLPDNELEAIILGDSLHLLGMKNQKFQRLKEEFIGTLQPPQKEVIQEMFAEQKTRGDPRDYDQFLHDSAADAFIRDYIFQRTGTIPGGKPFLSGFPIMGAFFPENMESLQKIESMVFGQ